MPSRPSLGELQGTQGLEGATVHDRGVGTLPFLQA